LDLASQPTLSHFENSVGPRQLYRLGEALASSVIERDAQRLDRLATFGLNPTDDPTHGAQQLSFFNGYCDSWCYLPVMGFVSFNDEAEQYLCAAVLRPGNVTATAGAVGIPRRLLMMVRHSFQGARIRVRGLTTYERIMENIEHTYETVKCHLRININKANHSAIPDLLDDLVRRDLSGNGMLYFAQLDDVNENSSQYAASVLSAREYAAIEPRLISEALQVDSSSAGARSMTRFHNFAMPILIISLTSRDSSRLSAFDVDRVTLKIASTIVSRLIFPS
jgi:hypothetical protein